MKGGLKANGFTIIETLIVLAISGSMLVAVVAMISGQQGKTQFQQSINQVSQQIQQIIGDVSNGYYPVSNISCSASGSSVDIIRLNGSSLGTNSDCVLVGKVIQFYQTQTSVPQQYTVYSMAGLRQPNGTVINPIAIAPGLNRYSTIPDNSTVGSLANGISLAYTTYTDISGTTQANNSKAFAILTNPITGAGVTDTSGAQQINIYAVNGTDAGALSANNVSAINMPANFVHITGYSICLTSGTTNQSGFITIGGGSRKLSVVLTIKDGKVC